MDVAFVADNAYLWMGCLVGSAHGTVRMDQKIELERAIVSRYGEHGAHLPPRPSLALREAVPLISIHPWMSTIPSPFVECPATATRVARSSLHISSEHALPVARSASCYGRAKDVLVRPIVVPKLKLGHIEGQIFFADLMKRSHYTTLEDRPEAFDGVGMYCANHVLPLRVVNDLVGIFFMQLAVAHPLIGDQQADVIRHSFIHKAGQGFGFHVGNDASHHTTLALYRSGHNSLPRSCSPCFAVPVAVVPILSFAADKGFVHFHDPAKLGSVTSGHSHSDSVAHVPSRFVGPEAHVAADLQGAHALLARQHQVSDFEPIQQRFIRVLEDRSANVREPIRRHGRTLVALPVPRVIFELGWIGLATTWTRHTFRPTLTDKVLAASVLIWKRFSELWNGQLMQKFLSGHDRVSNSMIGVSHG